MTQTTLFRIFNKFLKDTGCRDLFWQEVARYAVRRNITFKQKKEHIKKCYGSNMILNAFDWTQTHNGGIFWGLTDVAWQSHLNSL